MAEGKRTSRGGMGIVRVGMVDDVVEAVEIDQMYSVDEKGVVDRNRPC